MINVRLARRRTATGHRGQLLLASHDADRLGVASGETVRLQIGKWSGDVRISAAGGSESLYVPGRRAPRVPALKMACYKLEDNSLRLGPMLGILTMYRVTSRGPKGSQMSTYVEVMHRAREAGGFAFVFRASSVRSQSAIRGWTYANGRWVRCLMPFPDVVYNRIPSRPVERRVRRSGLLRRLRARGVSVFNPHYLDKWVVHRALMRDENVRPYLPETRRYRRPADVSVVLARYGRAFLKPAGGSLGLGAILVTRQTNGSLHYRMNTMSGRSRAGRLSRISALRRVMPSRSDYLVQRGIRLARIGGRLFDVRALVQKDGSGTWKLTGAAARIAGRGRVTTHVPRGGSRRGLKPVLNNIFGPEGAKDILERLEDACVKAAIGLETVSGKMFGELSLDIAIDTEGKLFILEINAKPFRFDEVHLRRLAQRRLVRFAGHLAGCPINDGLDKKPADHEAVPVSPDR